MHARPQASEDGPMTNDKAALNHRCLKFDPSPVTLSKKAFHTEASHQSAPINHTHVSHTLSLPPPPTFPGPRHPSPRSTLSLTSGKTPTLHNLFPPPPLLSRNTQVQNTHLVLQGWLLYKNTEGVLVLSGDLQVYARGCSPR